MSNEVEKPKSLLTGLAGVSKPGAIKMDTQTDKSTFQKAKKYLVENITEDVVDDASSKIKLFFEDLLLAPYKFYTRCVLKSWINHCGKSIVKIYAIVSGTVITCTIVYMILCHSLGAIGFAVGALCGVGFLIFIRPGDNQMVSFSKERLTDWSNKGRYKRSKPAYKKKMETEIGVKLSTEDRTVTASKAGANSNFKI